jgi:hypothetical protein
MKQTIKGWVYAEPDTFAEDTNAFHFGFMMYEPDPTIWKDRITVCEHSFDVDVPDNFDPRPGMVASLEAQKAKVRAELAARIKEIDDRIQSLLAIECSEVVS